MRPFAIAGLQLNISNYESNLPHILREIARVAHVYPWVQMVVISELATYGLSYANAQELEGEADAAYRLAAHRHGLWIVNGSIFEKSAEGTFNTSTVYSPQGEVVTRFRKMFPFMPYEEGISAGKEFCVFDIPNVGRFGLIICYDLWFPEITRTLACMGAEVILCPTLTNSWDREIELSIAKASAAINQCYIFDINGTGGGGYGRSIVVDPMGRVLNEAGSGPEVLACEIDLDIATEARVRGCRHLGQTLKSFRDRPIEFPIYSRDFDVSYLNHLGPVVKPQKRQ